MYVDDIAHERHVVARWFFNLGDNHDVSNAPSVRMLSISVLGAAHCLISHPT
jgi:hypothetical protein